MNGKRLASKARAAMMNREKVRLLRPLPVYGEMPELGLKEQFAKLSCGSNRTEGSNPSLSAKRHTSAKGYF